ncbi:MAG: PBP1A family penicillin-binding protein [Firmicutes bacterium]|nr:PBP1A family penicillin-binding protein [Bacillota bacterium]
MMMAAGGAVAALVYSSVADMPVFKPSDINFAEASDIYDESDNFVTRIGFENREEIDISEVPEIVKNAFIAIEDNRFKEHMGVDPYRIMGAAWADIKSGSLKEGASTITQQLVRQSIEAISTEKKFKRKIQEAILAIQMERHFTKDEILENYLNGIYLGEGAYGIQAAAQTYFSKDVSQLTVEEAALLAGLPQAPSAYNPFNNPEDAKERRNIVIKQMAQYGYINANEAEEARNKEIVLDKGKKTTNEYPYPYYRDYVIRMLKEKVGLTDPDIFSQGLKIYTTLSPEIQQHAEKAVQNKEYYPPPMQDSNGNPVGNDGAAVVLDPHTGHIKALVGSKDPNPNQMAWNKATHEQRRPGSTFKPIIAYGPAVEYLGKSPASVFDDIPTSIGNYSPSNYGGTYYGLITMRYALTKSQNVVAVKLLQETGLNKAVDFAANLGFENDRKQIMESGLAAALGGLKYGVTPLQMAAAYGTFANNGIYTEPIAIRRVEKQDGTVLYESKPEKHRAMKETTAVIITDMLQDVARKGTGTNATKGITVPLAGKTGTADNSQNKTADVWFAGYSPDLVTVTWVGSDNQRVKLNGKWPGAYGATYPSYIWNDIMSNIYKDSTPKNNFTSPRAAGLVRATVDSKSGKLPGPHTPEDHLVTDWFVPGTVPTEVDDTHVLMEVCAVNGKLPSIYCTQRVTKVFIKLPYKVSEKVKDYELRAPTEICDMHTEENNDGWLPNMDELNPWAPVDENEQPTQEGEQQNNSDSQENQDDKNNKKPNDKKED